MTTKGQDVEMDSGELNLVFSCSRCVLENVRSLTDCSPFNEFDAMSGWCVLCVECGFPNQIFNYETVWLSEIVRRNLSRLSARAQGKYMATLPLYEAAAGKGVHFSQTVEYDDGCIEPFPDDYAGGGTPEH